MPEWFTNTANDLVTVVANFFCLWLAYLKLQADIRRSDADTKKVLADIKEAGEATKKQVTNDHKTNLRDDITELIVSVKALAKTGDERNQRFINWCGTLQKHVDELDQKSSKTHREIFERLNAVERGQYRNKK